jgi:F-box/WD-40 domain protein 7
MELMSDPVIVATGHTYDRTCIAKWLSQGNRTCPVTGLRLRHLELTPNIALRNAIQVRARGGGRRQRLLLCVTAARSGCVAQAVLAAAACTFPGVPPACPRHTKQPCVDVGQASHICPLCDSCC